MKKVYYIRLAASCIVFASFILAVRGVYSFSPADIELAALLQRNFAAFSWGAFSLIAVIIVITLAFGRFYCSIICPLGILQEFASLIFRTKNELMNNYKLKYIVAAASFGVLAGGSALIIRYIDPYTIFCSALSLSLFGICMAAAIIVLVFFKKRFFCTNICPAGALLGIISKISLNKIYTDEEKCISCGLCAQKCPSGCINYAEQNIDNETCIKCLKCLCVCPQGALKYGSAGKKAKFSLKRRELIWAFSTLIVLEAAVKSGIEISRNFIKQARDVIIPAGAESTNKMANKCLNCNLCIKNCPAEILAKADKNFPAVHIDYSKGLGFCIYDCVKCARICPSGAIKKISLDIKQKTRIAMAVINENKCTGCGICINECPKGALSQIRGKTIIDTSKCIGCGKCKKSCYYNAINIFAVNEQKII